MIDAACNYINPYTSKFPTAAAASTIATNYDRITAIDEDVKPEFIPMPSTFYKPSAANLQAGQNDYNAFYNKLNVLSSASSSTQADKVQTLPQSQYPPQPSSTGSASPNSSLSASASPTIFPSPSSFSSTASSPQNDLTSAGYTWNAYPGLTARPQFPYAQYATPDYYSNMSMSASAAAAGWFSHQAWPSNSYAGFNFEDIAFQTQLQRRSVRCTCPNCTNEMSGLPPIVGPDERGRKQHICHIPGCERLYGKASHLKTHLRWHTGERPFLCLTCGKRFSRSDELQRHGRTHTNYRPYSCPICSKKFSRSDHLSKHKKTHFKDKKSKKVEGKESATVAKKEPTAEPVKAASKQQTTVQMPQTATNNNVQMKTEPTTSSTSSTSVSASTAHNEIPSGYTPYSPYQNSSSALYSHHHQLFYNRPMEATTSSSSVSSALLGQQHEMQSKTAATNIQQNYNHSPVSVSSSSSASQSAQHTLAASHHQQSYDALHLQMNAQSSAGTSYPNFGQIKNDYPYHHEYSSSNYPTMAAAHHPWTNYHHSAV